jgi:hypothetical protein
MRREAVKPYFEAIFQQLPGSNDEKYANLGQSKRAPAVMLMASNCEVPRSVLGRCSEFKLGTQEYKSQIYSNLTCKSHSDSVELWA